MKKVLVIYPGSRTFEDSPFYLFDPETGECLANHFCSGADFAKGDLHDNRSGRLKEWREKFGMETEVKFIDETDYSWEKIYELNQKLRPKED